MKETNSYTALRMNSQSQIVELTGISLLYPYICKYGEVHTFGFILNLLIIF